MCNILEIKAAGCSPAPPFLIRWPISNSFPLGREEDRLYRSGDIACNCTAWLYPQVYRFSIFPHD